MPMIREDEQTSSADDDDDDQAATANHGCPPPPAPLLPPRPLHETSTCGQWTHRNPATVVSAAGVELAGCSPNLVETPTNHDGRQPAPPTCTSPSLLDAMHKKYCAIQYVRRREQQSTHGCCGNAHLLGAVNRTSLTRLKDARPSADHDSATVGDFIARQSDVAERVTGNHVTSRGDCGSAPDSAVCITKTNSVNACILTTPSVDVTSSLNTSGFDDEQDEGSDDDDDEDDDEQKEVEQDTSKSTELFDDRPWKKRFCDFCHGELEVKLHFLTSSDNTKCMFTAPNVSR